MVYSFYRKLSSHYFKSGIEPELLTIQCRAAIAIICITFFSNASINLDIKSIFVCSSEDFDVSIKPIEPACVAILAY